MDKFVKDLRDGLNSPHLVERRQIAKDNIEYAIKFCGGNDSTLNYEALLDKLGFHDT